MIRMEMLKELRFVLNAPGTDVTWTDFTLLGYLAEGQDVFCEDTGYFVDLSNFTITLETGVAVYSIPDRVIQILNIWDGTRKLSKLDTGEEFYGDVIAGAPEVWRTDKETGSLQFDREPTSAENGDSYVLQAWRYSLYDLAGVDDDGAAAQPEIPSRFHRACIEWGAYKAFDHHDMETQDPVKARDHKDNFDMYVKQGITAMRRYHNIETRVGTSPAYRT